MDNDLMSKAGRDKGLFTRAIFAATFSILINAIE